MIAMKEYGQVELHFHFYLTLAQNRITLIPEQEPPAPHWIELVRTLEGTGQSLGPGRNYCAVAY